MKGCLTCWRVHTSMQIGINDWVNCVINRVICINMAATNLTPKRNPYASKLCLTQTEWQLTVWLMVIFCRMFMITKTKWWLYYRLVFDEFYNKKWCHLEFERFSVVKCVGIILMCDSNGRHHHYFSWLVHEWILSSIFIVFIRFES